MRHLLLPTDFSNYAYNACLYAIHLAAHYKAKLTIFHAYHIPIVDPLMPSEYLSDLANSAEKEIKSKMEELVSRLKEYKSANNLNEFEIEQHITMGFGVDEIINISEKEKPDMIIMGRRYTEGMARILLGSITAVVLDKAAIPVMIVPENVKAGEAITDVLYAIEYNEGDVKTIDKLLLITKPLRAKIHCVHISTEEGKVSVQKMEDLKKNYADEISQGFMEFKNISSETVMEGLSDYIEDNDVNIMAMLTHKRSFFMKLFDRSFTKKIAFKTNIPLLVFHN